MAIQAGYSKEPHTDGFVPLIIVGSAITLFGVYEGFSAFHSIGKAGRHLYLSGNGVMVPIGNKKD